ncbi:anti-anti-sigma regulatory factor [Actinoplanes octamycinicus]|uniref:Anti-anti-sigma regulatory factor n=1 Tax=Actinoplanes octamycinicus TaxID=135948 RepID=A0A7W7M9N8_9ACTN|nr:hypothetical protein [Actinoplanes octamycinicus]MBB4742189.1 anti-anti-sigma regulatory factor [Actinoplanes octamycinicus]GIE59965.1 hypothetical protein Aoc01nite_53670 [Actinoplanes octamycinicus]
MIVVTSTNSRRSPRRRKVVRASKRFEKDPAASFERRLFRTCTAPSAHRVDVDLTGVTAPAADTMAMLLHARFVMRQRGGELRVIRCPDSLLPLVAACGLRDTVVTHQDEPDFAA